MDELKIVFTTFGTEADAIEMANDLLKKDLAACCNLIPGVRSFYRWQGQLEDQGEVIMLIKTRAGRVRDVIRALEDQHSYDIPPVEVLSVEEANKAFKDWILDETF